MALAGTGVVTTRLYSSLRTTYQIKVDQALRSQVDDEIGADAWFALDFDVATLGQNNLSADAEPESDALFVLLLVFFEFSEVLEKLLLALLRYTAACVLKYHLKAQPFLCTAERALFRSL